MWNKFRQSINRIFNNQGKNDVLDKDLFEKQKDFLPQSQFLHTKMTYKYPTRQSFIKPSISKSKKVMGKSAIDIPAYQRKGRPNRQRAQKMDDLSSHDRYEQEKDLKKRFEPSEVASPIYGFQSRRTTLAIRNNQDMLPIDDLKEEDSDRNLQQNERLKESFIEAPKDANNTNKTIHRKRGNTPSESNEQVRPSHGNRDNGPTKNRVRERNKRKENRETQHGQLKKKDNHTKAIPYNVMMTPKDKWLYNQSRKHRQDDKNNYHIPINLLKRAPQKTAEDHLWVDEQRQKLEQTFKHFNVKARVVHATQGPTVTRFEVQPDFGVKVSRIRNLVDDIKLNMAAKDIRMEAPIPGKHTIGIEIPNLTPQMVRIRELIDTPSFKKKTSKLTVGLGLDVEGKTRLTDISKMPHGLIAGATGSGKSVCINTILISLIYRAHYDDVKLLLIDPKMVELAPYNGIPHLVAPVITDVKAATKALKWAVQEMEERYDIFVKEGVRDITSYNDKMTKEKSDQKMPFLVIIIDELADLMMMAPQDVEDSIARIAQKARACGIHLILATQRPSVDVITGLIKANIPTRIAFSVSSQIDSRTIMDTNGAERLLGKGDMLFVENGSRKNVRLQGAFVSDEEIERVTSYVKTLAQPKYTFDPEELLLEMEHEENEDELLDEVIQFVLEQDRVSTSLLQRQFRIGYNRAARLIDSLEAKGIISGPNGSKPREVLKTVQ